MTLGISGKNALHCVEVTFGVIAFALLILVYGLGN
jgi:hypothetical protein